MLVHISGAPIWRPENSANIWNLLWLSRQVIICTEQTGIYLRSFPNALTSKKAQNHEISIDRFHCHAIKSKTIQCKKLRNCDVIEDK